MLNPILPDVPCVVDSERLVLRCPQVSDGEVLYRAVSESIGELRQFIASVPWVAVEPSVGASESYCRSAVSNFRARTDMPYLVFERSSSALVGCVGLHRPDWALPKFEVGYWCRSSKSGHGYISEAVQAVVEMAEAQLFAARVELITDADNLKSRAVAERTGFQLEETLQEERHPPDGSLRCMCLYARTSKAGYPLHMDSLIQKKNE